MSKKRPKSKLKKRPALTEKDIQVAIAKRFPGAKTEVATKHGRIDILSPKVIVEIKKASMWKAGVGQLLVYQSEHSRREMILYLFGEIEQEKKKAIKEFCTKKKIKVIFRRADEEKKLPSKKIPKGTSKKGRCNHHK